MNFLLTKADLLQRQSLPLEAKVSLSQQRIRQWYEAFDGNVCVSFSGGKDSTVLLDLARDLFPEVPAVFADTGLEYPEVREHVRTFDNVITVRPKMNFKEVIQTYGYPVIGKEVARTIRYARQGSEWALRKMEGKNGKDNHESRWCATHYKQWAYLVDAPFQISDMCCDIMKKQPMRQYQRETKRLPIVGTMACESGRRQQAYLQVGCNAYEGAHQRSMPLAVWTEQDILRYLQIRKLAIPKVYGDIVEDEKGLRTTGVLRTGCMFCAFGAQCEKSPNRFERLKKTHPKQYDFCMRDENGLGMGRVLDYLNIRH